MHLFFKLDLRGEKMKREQRRKKKQRMQRSVILMIFAAFFLGVLCGRLVFAEKNAPEKERVFNGAEVCLKLPCEETDEGLQGNLQQQKEKIPWNLMLVNKTNFMEAGYEPKLAEVENNYLVDERIVKDLQNMLKDGRKEGLDFWICSAYRSMEKQSDLYENKVRRLRKEGMSEEQAQRQAGTEVAYPGTSEHQLGLAVDIVAKDYQILDEKQAYTREAKWLKENCWKYGFILRYPLDHTEKTGIIFEPWHYRYVGKDAAKEIREQETCLEEYLENLYGEK